MTDSVTVTIQQTAHGWSFVVCTLVPGVNETITVGETLAMGNAGTFDAAVGSVEGVVKRFERFRTR